MLYQYSPCLLDDLANRKVDLYARAKYDVLLGWIYDFNVTDYLYYFFPQLQNHVEDLKQCFETFDGTRNAIILVDERRMRGAVA